jgi:hypothetical protein
MIGRMPNSKENLLFHLHGSSDNALAKARKKRTDDDLPVHSFPTLLADTAFCQRGTSV